MNIYVLKRKQNDMSKIVSFGDSTGLWIIKSAEDSDSTTCL